MFSYARVFFERETQRICRSNLLDVKKLYKLTPANRIKEVGEKKSKQRETGTTIILAVSVAMGALPNAL